MNDLISRQAAIEALRYAQHRFTVADEAGGMGTVKWGEDVIYFAAAERVLSELPSAQPEPLTDKEQRIFLAAMGREEKVCKEVDAEMTREPYEDSLVRVCHEIIRKVKGALWT